MAFIEKIKKGQKYRVVTDSVKHIWEVKSFWTHSDDIHFDDGETLTEKMAKVYEALKLE